jgi:hypothetical protein
MRSGAPRGRTTAAERFAVGESGHETEALREYIATA